MRPAGPAGDLFQRFDLAVVEAVRGEVEPAGEVGCGAGVTAHEIDVYGHRVWHD